MMKKLILLWACLAISFTTVIAQTTNVTGIVISEEDNQPVVGATILVKGTTIGAITDMDGRFTLSNVSRSAEYLTVSYIGLLTREVKIAPNLTVYLKPDAQLIDEVVVVAYGTAKRSSLTGAISTVNSDKITARPVSSAPAALEGTTTGIMVNNSYGEPGSDPTILVRGVNSINGNYTPLYVVDGVVYTGNSGDINPNDIESISVLKDAASAALYGNRAANGVILITTKSGRSEKSRVRMNLSQGFYRRAMNDYDRLGSNDWMETMWAGYRNSLMSTKDSSYPTFELANAEANRTFISNIIMYNIYNKGDEELFDANGKLVTDAKVWNNIAGDLDWMKSIERTGHRQDYSVSADGTAGKSDYYFSAGYLKEEGYVKTSDYERFTGRMKINVEPVKWIKAGMNLSGTHSIQNQTTGDSDSNTSFSNPFFFGRNMAPVYPVHLFDLDTGDYILDQNGNKQYDNGDLNNRNQYPNRHVIWEYELNKRTYKRTILTAQAFADIKFFDFTFSVKGDASYRNTTNLKYDNNIIGDGKGANGRLAETIYKYREYTFQQQLSWQKLLNDTHFVDVMVGHENYDYSRHYRYLFKTDQTLEENYVMSNFNTVSSLNGYHDTYKTESYLGRARYNYKEKYFLEASYRRDGSSRFYKDNRWGNFWSVGASWMLSEETFMVPVKNVINNLKLRASYGEVGNDRGVDYYGYMALLTLSKNGESGAVYKSQNQALDIKWETTQSFGVALEGRMVNRLNFSMEYFDKRAKDLLYDMYLPLSAGATSNTSATSTVTRNVGTISNRGFEFAIDVDVYKSKDWRWNVGTNLTLQNNKVVKLPDENKQGIISGTTKIVEGKSRYAWWTYLWAGVDQMTGNSLYLPNLEDYTAGGTGLGSSEIPEEYLVKINDEYYTTNTTYAKRDFCGTATPKVFGGVTTSLSWKNLTLSLLCTYSAGNKVYDNTYSSLMSMSGSPSALHKDILKSWSGIPEGMTENSPNRIDPKGTPVVDFNRSSDNNATSSRFLQNGSYFSIKNINLNYHFPGGMVKRCGLGGISVNCSVENVAIFTALQGMNSQQQRNGRIFNAFMPARVFTLGLNVSL